MYYRKSNFELLRIICMIMVVLLHSIGHSGIIYNTNIDSFNFIIFMILESISIVSVNVYILISGYFGISSNFKLDRIIRIYKQVLFYSISI